MNRFWKRFLAALLVFSTTFLQLAPGYVYAQSISYSYDANGNVTSDGIECYSYNDANKISQVRDCSTNDLIAEYVYDHSGQRGIKKIYENGALVSTSYTVGDHFETKVAADSTQTDTSYYRVNDELVARKNNNGDKFFYHNDHLQSTSIVTDSSGNLVEETEYQPYGEVLTGGTQGKYQFTGQELDSETNLAYYGARYYDPSLKRFIQPDSILPDVYDPQSLNRYAYVRNNPIKYTDPSGHFFIVDDLIAAGIILGGLSAIGGVASIPVTTFGFAVAGGVHWQTNGSENFLDGIRDGAIEGYNASAETGITIAALGGQLYEGSMIAQSLQPKSKISFINNVPVDEEEVFTQTQFKGKQVWQTNKINPNQIDPKTGMTNAELMAKGNSPIGFDGSKINLHHVNQNDKGALAEINGSLHRGFYSELHSNTGQSPSQVDRSSFNFWRKNYWMGRSNGITK